MKIRKSGTGPIQPQTESEVDASQESLDTSRTKGTSEAAEANFAILDRELQALGYDYGTRTGMRKSELANVLTQHPELIESALRLAYLSGEQTTSPEISTSTSLNLATFNNALQDLVNLVQASPDSPQSEADIDDYLTYSPISYAARQLKPEEQRVLYAQLMATRVLQKQPELVESKEPSPAVRKASESQSQRVNSQVKSLLKEGETLFDNEDFAGAYKNFAEALKLAPTITSQLPELNYYLGVSAKYSDDDNLVPLAASYYEKYLASPGGSTSTKEWVRNDLQWMNAAPEANAAAKNAQDLLWKENDPYRALSTLKAAVEKYPQLASKDPTTYYFLAIYAYSAGDLTAAKKYITDAKTALLSRDQNDPTVKFYIEQIDKFAKEIDTFKFNTWSTDKLRQGLAGILGDGPMAQKISKAVSNSLSNWYVPGAKWTKEKTTRVWELTADKDGSFRTQARKREDNLLDEVFEGAQYKIFDNEKLGPLEYLSASELKAETFAKAKLDTESAKKFLSEKEFARLENAKTNEERVAILKENKSKLVAAALKSKDELDRRIDQDPDSVFPAPVKAEGKPIEGIEKLPLETRLKLLRGEKLTKEEFERAMDVAPDAVLGRVPDTRVGSAPEGLKDLSTDMRMKLLRGEKLSPQEFEQVMDIAPGALLPSVPKSQDSGKVTGRENLSTETRLKLLKDEQLSPEEFRQILDKAPEALGLPGKPQGASGAASDAEFQARFNEYSNARDQMSRLDSARLKLKQGENLSPLEYLAASKLDPKMLTNAKLDRSQLPLETQLEIIAANTPQEKAQVLKSIEDHLVDTAKMQARLNALKADGGDIELPSVPTHQPKRGGGGGGGDEQELQARLDRLKGDTTKKAEPDLVGQELQARLDRLKGDTTKKTEPDLVGQELQARLDRLKGDSTKKTEPDLVGQELQARLDRLKSGPTSKAEPDLDGQELQARLDRLKGDTTKKAEPDLVGQELQARLDRLKGDTSKKTEPDLVGQELQARLDRLKGDATKKAEPDLVGQELQARLDRLKGDTSKKTEPDLVGQELQARLDRLKGDTTKKAEPDLVGQELQARLDRLKGDTTKKTEPDLVGQELQARLDRLKGDSTKKTEPDLVGQELQARLDRLKSGPTSKAEPDLDGQELQARLDRLKSGDKGVTPEEHSTVSHDDEELVFPEVPTGKPKKRERDELEERLAALRGKDSDIKPLKEGLTPHEERQQQLGDLARLKAIGGEKLTPNEYLAASKTHPEILANAQLDHSELPKGISKQLAAAKTPDEKAKILETLDEGTRFTKAERAAAKKVPLSEAEHEALIKSLEDEKVPDHTPTLSDKISQASDKAVDAVKNSALAKGLEKAGFEVNTRKLEARELAPGWWGGGTTLGRAQAAAFQWSLAQGPDGSVTNDWRGPFATTSNYDPTSQQVSLINSGEGLDKKYLGVNLGVNMLNAEARAYGSFYGGGSGKIGVGGAIGGQARANLMDVNAGINYSAGSTTIGDTKIDNLFGVSAAGQASVGVQADGNIGLVLAKDKVQVGGSVGAFAGAQASGMASVNALGIGANVTAQAWAGVGAKLTANASYEHGKLSFNLGVGAALEYGGYVELGVSIDFNQIANMLKGLGEAGVNMAADWGKTAPGVGHVAGFVAGAASGAAQLVADTAGAIGKTAEGIGDVLTGTKILSPIGVPLQQVGQLLNAPSEMIASSKKPSAKAFEEARNAFSKGKVFTGIAKGLGGSIKAVGEGLISLFGGQKVRKQPPPDDKS